MKHFVLILFTLYFCLPGSAQHVEVSTLSSDAPNASFIGGSTEFMYPILEGRVSQDTALYDSIWFGNGVVEALGPLQNNFLRFPGGTISQFYHFRGEHGYGTTAFDLECREGYLNLRGFSQKVRVDQFYPENMIDTYIDLVRELDVHTEEDIQTIYVLNMMTHYFNGDLIPWNTFLDELITSYGTSLNVFLDLNPSLMDDQAMNETVTVMNNIYRDPLIDELIEWLVQQPGFQERLTENLAAIAYLLENETPIAGVELGNENYAFAMLKDDDLSNVPYDCTTPDSIVVEYGSLSLPLRAYMQAILKFSMLSSIYSSLVKDVWNLPTGAVINSTVFEIDIESLDQFSISESATEKARYFELWNRFIGSQNFYDAVIPHIYMKSLPKCEAFEDLGVDSTAKFGKHYLDFYFEEVLDYQFNSIREQVNNHPMWITEWNINTANIFGNTFLHASHCFQFMNNLNESASDYDIRLINYHNLASWVYNQFALIRTEEVNQEYTVNLQSTYHPFKLMGETHSRGDLRSNTDFITWLGSEQNTKPDNYYYSYLSVDGKELIINYINQSSKTLNIPLTDVTFGVEIDGNAQMIMRANNCRHEYMNATSLYGSNRGCDDYPEYYEEYSWDESEGTATDISIPAYSLGKLTLDLELVSGSEALYHAHNFNVFPNPASTNITIESTGLEQLSKPMIDICDITGKVIQTTTASEKTHISVKALNPGIYLIHLSDLGRTISTSRKLVVN